MTFDIEKRHSRQKVPLSQRQGSRGFRLTAELIRVQKDQGYSVVMAKESIGRPCRWMGDMEGLG